MAVRKILLRRGLGAPPTLDVGEPAFSIDTGKVYVGTVGGNVVLANAEHNHDETYIKAETDPTVPTWAKQELKPSYTTDEVTPANDKLYVTAGEKQAWSDNGINLVATNVLIFTSDWVGLQCTKIVEGIIPSSIVWLSPAPHSYLGYTNSQVRGITLGEGTIEFECTTLPTSHLSIDMIIGG